MGRSVTNRCALAPLDDRTGFNGVHISIAAGQLGMSRQKAADYLYRQGYRNTSGILQRIKTVNEIEDEINARPVSNGPCFRCGGRVCGCGRRG